MLEDVQIFKDGRKVILSHEVERRSPVSLPRLFQLMNAGRFPRGFEISRKMHGWFEDEVEEALEKYRQHRTAHRRTPREEAGLPEAQA